MTVRNDGDQRLRLQVSVMAWNQNKLGEMVLDPTDDIIFYPNLLTLEPGAQRNLRVGVNGAVVAREKSYRIFVEELPSNVKLQFTGVRILPRSAFLSLFDRRKQSIKIQSNESGSGVPMSPSSSRTRVTCIFNRGNYESKGLLQTAAYSSSAKFPAGTFSPAVYESIASTWSKSECMKIRELTVEVDLEDKPFKETLVVPSGSLRTLT